MGRLRVSSLNRLWAVGSWFRRSRGRRWALNASGRAGHVMAVWHGLVQAALVIGPSPGLKPSQKCPYLYRVMYTVIEFPTYYR